MQRSWTPNRGSSAYRVLGTIAATLFGVFFVVGLIALFQTLPRDCTTYAARYCTGAWSDGRLGVLAWMAWTAGMTCLAAAVAALPRRTADPFDSAYPFTAPAPTPGNQVFQRGDQPTDPYNAEALAYGGRPNAPAPPDREPGWKADPWGPTGQTRYWDGEAWSPKTR